MSEKKEYQGEILLETGTNELEIIIFYLRHFDEMSGQLIDVHYGINAAKVSEMIAFPKEVTAIAQSPEYIEGVFLLRGKTIPLINVCKWFQYKPDLSPEAMKRWTVIVAELNGKHFGFVSHGVDKVYRTSWESIKPPHELIASSKSITGMVLIEDRLVQMIDFENIIASFDSTMNINASEIDREKMSITDQGGRVVVIADDSKVVRDLLSKTLTSAKYKVVEHYDGQSCWDYLQQVQEQGRVEDKVFAVITDIEMPRMDGHNLCFRMRDDSAFDKVPVILFSSMINDALRLKGIKVGADDQVTKPEIGSLIERMQNLILKYRG